MGGSVMAKFIETGRMTDALYDAGAIDEEPSCVRRVVIDLEAGKPGRIYIEKFADDEKLLVAIQGGLTVVAEDAA